MAVVPGTFIAGLLVGVEQVVHCALGVMQQVVQCPLEVVVLFLN